MVGTISSKRVTLQEVEDSQRRAQRCSFGMTL